MDELVEHHLVGGRIVEVAGVGAEHESRLVRSGNGLQHIGLSNVHLDGVGACGNQ